MSRAAVALIALAGLLQSAPAKVPGFLIERKVRLLIHDLAGRPSEIQRTERVKISGGSVCLEDLTFGTTLILRPDLGKAWRIDRLKGTCAETTFDRIAKRRAESVAMLQEARKRVPGTSDEKDIGVTLLRLGEMDPAVEVAVRDTGKNENLLGRACTGREILLRLEKDTHYIDVQVDPTLTGALGYFDTL